MNNNLPKHVAVIMDGNRRWAKKRLLPANMGHKKGAEIFKSRINDLAALNYNGKGITHATFYALSTENLNRERDEVLSLLNLFEQQLDELETTTNENDIRLEFIGDFSPFSPSLKQKIEKATKGSQNNKGLICYLALNYGGRREIVYAAKKMAQKGIFTEEELKNSLYSNAPDVDLLIRTGGEKRISNFLLCQMAYAELYFTDTLWCDFSKAELDKALTDFENRNRRLGK